MAVTPKTLVESKFCESSQTTQYTATGVTTIIDKFTATNVYTAAQTISVNLVPSGGSAGSSNLVVKTKTLQPGECYTMPEIVGQILGPSDFISCLAGAANEIVIRISGREVTS